MIRRIMKFVKRIEIWGGALVIVLICSLGVALANQDRHERTSRAAMRESLTKFLQQSHDEARFNEAMEDIESAAFVTDKEIMAALLTLIHQQSNH